MTRGRKEMYAVMALSPLDVDSLDLPDDVDDITDEQHDLCTRVLREFWDSEGVAWDEVVEVAAAIGEADVRKYLAGVALTPEEMDHLVAAFAAAHLGGFTVGWMMSRDMGLKLEEEA